MDVSGMLLYARTTGSIQPDSDYVMSGNKFQLTLGLNQDFKFIKGQLDNIVTRYLLKGDNIERI